LHPAIPTSNALLLPQDLLDIRMAPGRGACTEMRHMDCARHSYPENEAISRPRYSRLLLFAGRKINMEIRKKNGTFFCLKWQRIWASI